MHHGVHRLLRTSERLQISSRQLRPTRWLRTYSAESNNGQQNIAVLGGGITGLATAYYITQRMPRAKVTIFEASDRIGGWLLSKRVPVSGGNVLFEGGPRSLRTAKNGILAVRLIDELKLQDDTIFTPTSSPAANHRYIYCPDRLVRLPHPSFGLLDSIKTLVTEPIFQQVLPGLVSEPFKNARDPSVKDESVGDFFTRKFGRHAVDNLVSAMLHGIYAGDAYQLSARSLFPGVWRNDTRGTSMLQGAFTSMRRGVEMSMRDVQFADEVQSIDRKLLRRFANTSVFTFKDGIGMLVDRLARHLWASGSTEVKTSTKVSSLEMLEDGIAVVVDGEQKSQTFDNVVSALSPAHLNTLIKAPEDRIPEIPSVTVMTVNLFFKKAEILPPGPTTDRLGFGYLIPRAVPFERNPERALGVVFDHAYALPKITSVKEDEPRVTQDTLDQDGTKVTVMLGGHWWNDWPAYPDEHEGLKMALSVLERHLGIKQAPEAYQVNLQTNCIPQYTVGHEDRLETAHKNLWRAYKGRLRVAGSWIEGVGVNDCLRSAYNVVRRLEDRTDGTGLEHVGNEEIVRVKVAARPEASG